MSRMGRIRKYNNRDCICSLGHKHPSFLECSVCQIIQLEERAGEIKLIQVQERIILCGPPGHVCPNKKIYVADFKCLDLKIGLEFRIEAKGGDDGKGDSRWPTTKTLWKHYGPSKLEIWGGTHQRPYLIEVLQKGVLVE